MRLTIKAKLIGGFATVILLSGAMGGIAYTKLEEMAAAQQELALWTKRVNAIMDISDDLHNSVRAEKNALLVSLRTPTSNATPPARSNIARAP